MTNYQSSTAFWLIVNTLMLTLASTLTLEFTPIGYEITSQSDRIDVLDKIDHFPNDQSATILMLGSSLGIFPAALSDFKNFGEPKPGADRFLNYSSFRYLDQQLNKRQCSSSGAVQTLNLSHQGGMTSENLLLLKASLKAGIKPSLVILLSGPRDFLDHQTNKVGQSKLAKALMVRISDAIWNSTDSASANLETLASRFIPLYAQRDAVTKLLSSKLKQAVAYIRKQPYREKPTQTGGSLETVRDEPGTAEMLDFYEANYKIRYLPIDWQRWQQESEALAKIGDVCREQNLPLLLVTMPLSELNRDLLPRDFVLKHQTMIKDFVEKERTQHCQIALLDLFADDKYKIDDFMDSVHLRSCGGMKLATQISEIIERNNLLKRKQ